MSSGRSWCGSGCRRGVGGCGAFWRGCMRVCPNPFAPGDALAATKDEPQTGCRKHANRNDDRPMERSIFRPRRNFPGQLRDIKLSANNREGNLRTNRADGGDEARSTQKDSASDLVVHSAW